MASRHRHIGQPGLLFASMKWIVFRRLECIKNEVGQNSRHPREGRGLEDRCSHLL